RPGRRRAGARGQLLARAAARGADSRALGVARGDGQGAHGDGEAEAARLEPRGRHAHRHVQPADASVGAAEEQTQAAYTGAIRALATALDARDPYTAGHSERVSVLSVAVGRALSLTEDELEVLRLGALLHD